MNRAHPEHDLQRRIVRMLNTGILRPGVFWTAINPLPGRDVVSGAQAKQLGVVAGVPDLVFVYRGYSLWVELKADKRGRLSTVQQAAHLKLTGALDHAGAVVTITSTSDLLEALSVRSMTRAVGIAA
jgi:hypothetical protein